MKTKKSFPITDQSSFQIPRGVLAETESFLKIAGESGKECSVFWGGIGRGEVADVESVYFPVQTATPVSVEVHPDGIHTMYEALDSKNEMLLAQVHSHPGAAFHSGTDDSFPATFFVGFLSIVVPNFCSAGLNGFADCAVFCHRGNGVWARMNPPEIKTRLRIVED